MASKLGSLIRYSKFKLDEERRLLTAFQDQLDALTVEETALAKEIEQEIDFARDQMAVSWTFQNWQQAMALKKQGMQQQRDALEEKIETTRERIAIAFQELKKYELAEKAEKQKIKDKEKKVENDLMDEAALQGFIRKSE